jgi:hypothetical protein
MVDRKQILTMVQSHGAYGRSIAGHVLSKDCFLFLLLVPLGKKMWIGTDKAFLIYSLATDVWDRIHGSGTHTHYQASFAVTMYSMLVIFTVTNV